MRDGYVGNVELQRRAESSPIGAMLIPEFLRHVASDILDRPAHWQDRADSTVGFQFLQDGGVKLSGSVTVPADSNAGTDAVIAPLVGRPGNSASVHVLELAWKGSPELEIHRVRARLRAQADIGEAVEVEQWRCQLFRLARLNSPQQTLGRSFDLQPISRVVAVAVSGPSEETVTFDFRGEGSSPVVVGPGPDVTTGISDGAIPSGEELETDPRTYVAIWGVKGGGELAGNTAWVGDGGTLVKDAAEYVASVKTFAQPAAVDDGTIAGTRYVEQGVSGGLPRFELESRSYTEAAIAFTTKRLNLATAPTGPVEVVAVGQRPAQSGLTFELREPGGVTWHEVQDGDLIGEDNTATGGSDLSGLAVRQDYDARVTLTPSTAADRSPIARRFGIMERESVVFVGEGSVEAGEWGFSDLTRMKGQLTEVILRLQKTGVRDFRDPVTELFSENFPAELEMRLWFGHPDLARQYWLHIDSFLIDDWDAVNGSVVVQCVSVLTAARKIIPAYDSELRTREAFEYANVSLAAVYDDLLVGQIGLAGRRIGPGVDDEETLVTKWIEESDAKDELDRIAFLAGGGVISSQGRAKFVPLIDDGERQPNSTPVHVFERGSFTGERLSPGLADRVDEAFVLWGWNNVLEKFEGEDVGIHGNAFAHYGTARINPPLRLEDETSKWIPVSGVDDGDPPRTFSVLGERIAQRTVESLGVGRIVWPIRSNYPLPWLEPGDEVAIEVEDFIGRDPNDPHPIKGPLNARGVITRVHDPAGFRFSIWIRSYADLMPESATLERHGIPREPQVLDATVSISNDGSTPAEIVGDADTGSIRYLASKVARPLAEAIEAEAPIAGRTISSASLATLAAGERLWLSVIAYSGEAGEGPASDIFHVAPIQRPGILGPVEAAVTVSGEWTRGEGAGSLTDRQIALGIGLRSDVRSLHIRYGAVEAPTGTEITGAQDVDVDGSTFSSVSRILRNSAGAVVDFPDTYDADTQVTVDAYDAIGGQAGAGSILGSVRTTLLYQPGLNAVVASYGLLVPVGDTWIL